MVFSQATFVRPGRRYNGWYQYSSLNGLTILCSPGAPIQAYAWSNGIKLARFMGAELGGAEPEDRIFNVILYCDKAYGWPSDWPIRFDALLSILGGILPATAYLEQIVEE